MPDTVIVDVFVLRLFVLLPEVNSEREDGAAVFDLDADSLF